MSTRTLALLISFVTFAAGPVRAGTVTGATVTHGSVPVGTAASVIVSGTNPCGAAHINYGDGTAITYAITGLPTTQTHAYDRAGSYTVTVRGMGNCDGEVTTTVTVTAPAPPPPAPVQAAPAAQITDVEMTPLPGRTGQPITFKIVGTGTCSYEVHYGDGNAQEVTGQLPQQLRHTYGRVDTYTVIVKPAPPCIGKFTQQLPIVDAPVQVPRIVRVLVSPTPADAGQPVSMSLEGAGACAYAVDFGDGNSESRSGNLPDTFRHVYSAPGGYTVLVTATAPCTGSARARLEVRPLQVSGVTGVELVSASVPRSTAATIVINGSGTCAVVVDFGDGNSQTVSGPLPRRVTHTYPAAGRYRIQATADAPCTGSGVATLDVSRRRYEP